MTLPHRDDREACDVGDGAGHWRVDRAKDGSRRRILLSAGVSVSVLAMCVGWMFQGFSLVHLVLPDTSEVAPKAAATQAPTLSPTQRLRVWLAQVEPAFDDLIAVRDGITDAAVQLDDAELRRECGAGQAVLPRIQERMPSPDALLNTALQRTLDDYSLGFTLCLAGTQNDDAAGMEPAAVHLYRANEDLQAVMALLARELNSDGQHESDVVSI